MKLLKMSMMILFFATRSFADSTAGYVPAQQAIQANAPTQNSIYDSAAQTKKQNEAAQKQAQMISSTLDSSGQALVSSCCGGDCPSQCQLGLGLVVMGVMAGQQAASHGGTARGAGMTMDATDAYSDGRKVGESGSGFSTAASVIAAKLAKSGVKFDGAKFSANGIKLGADDMVSASAMAAAGLSKDNIAAINAEVAKANKAADIKFKLTTPNFGFEEGGGGSAYGNKSGAVPGGTDGVGGLAGAGQAHMGSLDAKAAVSGMTVNYKGDPIGVANDSIFGMMTRRYQLKERQESFFDLKTAVQK